LETKRKSLTMSSGQDTSEIRAGHEIPVQKLEDYLVKHVPGLTRPIKLRQFKVGQSNPTFLVIDGKEQRYVIRKKPTGKLVATAHMIEREFQILSALKKTGFPVPTVYSLCEDPNVIGTPFYAMEFLNGRIFTDVTLNELTPKERKACYDEAAKTLARLHSIDFRKIGLENYGKAGGFYERQISRMSTTSRAQEIPEKVPPLLYIDDLLKWFAANLPKDEVTIVHGDYKFDNIVFHPIESRVIGVLDWEMSTIGHPLSDLANICLPYYYPGGMPPPMEGLSGLGPEYGIPTEEEFLKEYCRQAKRSFPIEKWNFCISFSFFRMAVILQGIASRAAKGQASNPMAELIGSNASFLSEISYDISSKKDEKSKL